MKLRGLIILFLAALVAASVWIYYWAAASRINDAFGPPQFKNGVALRPLPYPFRAAIGLTVSPGQGLDLDKYLDLLTLLNTKRPTPLGPGLDLEVGGSFYFHPPSEDWPEFFGPVLTDSQRERVKRALEEGWLDTLDSFGAKDDFTRDDAGNALADLLNLGVKPRVWADRFDSPDDLNRARGRGDHPGKSTYHLDLSLAAGLEFFFLGRTTSILGQNAPVVTAAPVCLTKDRNFLVRWWLNGVAGLKFLFVVLTDSSGDIIRDNRLIGPVRFKDNHWAVEFSRYRGSSAPDGPPVWLSGPCLDELIARGGRIAVDQILSGPGHGLTPTQFIHLLSPAEKRIRDRELLLTAVGRLLAYTRLTEELTWRVKIKAGDLEIHLDKRRDMTGQGGQAAKAMTADQLAGLTFYVPDADRARLYLNGEEIWVRRNLMDYTGRESISVPWRSVRSPKPAE